MARSLPLALLLALPLGGALAQTLPPGVSEAQLPAPAKTRAGREQQAVEWFNLFDTDHDGRLSRKEARMAFALRPSLAEDFAKADLNGDGYLTQDEIRAVAERRRAERQQRRQREAEQRAATGATSAR
ncbi:MAG: EF-hand domain-containing protein [Ottowia sp.]|uniref:hypothetical protein n=1 Tax=Ottowia sp. TaxID=1898956 RepID=UPI0039E562D2